MERQHEILVIDDEREIGEFIADVAENFQIKCIITTNAQDFFQALNPNITLIFIDLLIPDLDGIEILRRLHEKRCESQLVLISGFDKRVLETAEDLAKSLGLHVLGRLQKPFKISDLEKFFRLKTTSNTSFSTSKPSEAKFNLTEADLKRALEQNEFVLHYQPQIEITTSKMVGMEALIRWQHPKLGLIPPDSFIPLIESLGWYQAVDEWIINTGLQNLPKFAEKNGFFPTLSINICPQSLHDLKFPDKLVTLAKQYAVAPDRIVIEITESGLLNKLPETLDILTRLRMKKIQLSIDDFGTGYAMLQQLQQMPTTELKIDKTLIQDLTYKESAQIMTKKIIEMSHELNMKVIAEGVENEEQVTILKQMGCNIIQGYFYCPPLPATALLEWLEKRNAHSS